MVSLGFSSSSTWFRVDMQESEYFGETLLGQVFSDVELRYPSEGSVFWMLLGDLAFRKVLGMFHIYVSRWVNITCVRYWLFFHFQKFAT